MAQDGGFAKLPTWVMLRPDLTTGAKVTYAHLKDRQGDNGEAWPGIESIAAACGMSRKTAIRAIKQLEEKDLVRVIRRRGRNNHYIALDPTSPNVPLVPKRDQSQSGPTTSPKMALPPVPKRDSIQTHLSRPIESDSLIRSKKAKRLTKNDEAEAIYQAYPRHVGHLKAIASIAKALKAIRDRGEFDPVGWLTERVRTFAASDRGQAGEYTPHPATWFNQGRYDDDPAAWKIDGQPDRQKKVVPRVATPEELKRWNPITNLGE